MSSDSVLRPSLVWCISGVKVAKDSSTTESQPSLLRKRPGRDKGGTRREEMVVRALRRKHAREQSEHPSARPSFTTLQPADSTARNNGQSRTSGGRICGAGKRDPVHRRSDQWPYPLPPLSPPTIKLSYRKSSHVRKRAGIRLSITVSRPHQPIPK